MPSSESMADKVFNREPTLSIPVGIKEENPAFLKKLGMVPWPSGPNGHKIPSPVQVKSAIIFTGSTHQQKAKKLLSFLIQPDNLETYLERQQGRYLPVMPQLWKRQFWSATHTGRPPSRRPRKGAPCHCPCRCAGSSRRCARR
ncbi:MAG: extracellular solute-binding protein [Streptosporangiaceae bacterium]